MNSFTMIVGRKLIPPENGTLKEKSFVVSLYSGGKRKILYVREVFTLYAEEDNPRGGSAYCILNSRESSVVFGIAKQCPPPTHNEEYSTFLRKVHCIFRNVEGGAVRSEFTSYRLPPWGYKLYLLHAPHLMGGGGQIHYKGH
jgi:hypothetical protein